MRILKTRANNGVSRGDEYEAPAYRLPRRPNGIVGQGKQTIIIIQMKKIFYFLQTTSDEHVSCTENNIF